MGNTLFDSDIKNQWGDQLQRKSLNGFNACLREIEREKDPIRKSSLALAYASEYIIRGFPQHNLDPFRQIVRSFRSLVLQDKVNVSFEGNNYEWNIDAAKGETLSLMLPVSYGDLFANPKTRLSAFGLLVQVAAYSNEFIGRRPVGLPMMQCLKLHEAVTRDIGNIGILCASRLHEIVSPISLPTQARKSRLN